MKKAIYKLILFIAITAFVLSLSPTVTAEPNDTDTTQIQSVAPETKPIYKAHNQEPAPYKQSATNKENSQLQLAKEQLRGDFYKDSQDNLKWAIKIIVGLATAFVGFAFASMGVILFKNKKDYEHALTDAKEAARDAKDAAKNARDLEKEAQGVLADIEEKAKTMLEEIDTKANDKRKNIDKLVADKLEEIEKTSKKQKDESSKEFERQRKFTALFNKGYRAGEAKDYETAADCFRQIVEDLKEENNPDVYYNWGIALSGLARNKKGEEAEELFNQAFEKYKKAIEIKQNDYDAYDSWGAALLYLARLKGGEDAKDLLNQAEEKCLKAESIKTGGGSYNLACVYALRGNEDKCKEWLKIGEKAGTLDPREHAMADDDLKSVRNKEWFKTLRWKGE